MFGAGTRIISLGAQMLALFVMAWLMPKSDFGDLMTVFAIYRVLSYGIGTGCAATILYHVSRRPDDATEIRVHRTFAVIGLVLGALAVAALVLVAPLIASGIGKPRIAFWTLHLAPFGLLSTLVTLAGGHTTVVTQLTAQFSWWSCYPMLCAWPCWAYCSQWAVLPYWSPTCWRFRISWPGWRPCTAC
ncbi:hypothetical protein C7W88_17455 (plasmid) [Novosphingobium sp. THN1]|nr:hypothetical protein C7W88_17455 [Novosphingobium sp. THN1]